MVYAIQVGLVVNKRDTEPGGIVQKAPTVPGLTFQIVHMLLQVNSTHHAGAWYV